MKRIVLLAALFTCAVATAQTIQSERATRVRCRASCREIKIPRICSLSVLSGYVGAEVRVHGNNFGTRRGTSTISFNGSDATILDWDTTNITVLVPTAAPSGRVVVSACGMVSNGVNFTVIPKIANIVPASGPRGGPVIIYGSGFGATQGSNTLAIGDKTASISGWSTTAITATVPHTATTAAISITVSGVRVNDPSFNITGPTISSISMPAAWVGVAISIYGSNFGTTTGTVSVERRCPTTRIGQPRLACGLQLSHPENTEL